ncbi:hypothetical protein Celaphus_00008688 [Cervus elaphus hippelaphus]|uniref:Uncharacterized protein n=1 Tax=Cervus elaphus hippelaphus TaxID=46360 RepID=A0A212CPM7_CEREH|nr:hypothetical protein Celaphus_00008688 [Cervus elaphus hippelaphus]
MCRASARPARTRATSFMASCPISAFVPKEKIPDPHNLKLWLKANATVAAWMLIVERMRLDVCHVVLLPSAALSSGNIGLLSWRTGISISGSPMTSPL